MTQSHHLLRTIFIFFIFFAHDLMSLEVNDFRGQHIKLEKPADRIVCLLESALSGLYMLKAKDHIVAVPAEIYQPHLIDYYSVLDERIKNRELPTPGNWDFISLERIMALQPDLVILWASQTEAIKSIEAAGVPVYAVQINSFSDIHKEIKDLGTLCAKNKRAGYVLNLTDQKLAEIKQKISGISSAPPAVYFMWAQGLLETAGTNSTVQELLGLAGAENIITSELEHVVINIETLINGNPDVIVMWYNERKNPSDILADPRLQSLNAVKNKNVFELPSAFYCDFWTLKYLFTVKLITHWCYPEKYPDFNPDQEIKDLMFNLYDKNF